MWHKIQKLIALIVTDLCLFPISLWILPSMNLKMLMAAVGVFLLIVDWIRNRVPTLSSTLLWLSLAAALLSLMTFASTVFNGTHDYVLVSYVVSMWVWFFAAYTVCKYIVHVHGTINMPIIGEYLFGVMVLQCVLALMIDNMPAVQAFCDSHFFSDMYDSSHLNLYQRIYGVGAALDVAGIRFACILVVYVFNMLKDKTASTGRIILQWSAFLFSIVVGCMISRTTIVGTAIALVVFVFSSLSGIFERLAGMESRRFWVLVAVVLAGVVLCVALYNRDDSVRTHLRFGFEGFFNWAEKGELSTHSTDMLRDMHRWPTELKTWLIGDGRWEGDDGSFYMYTDVGYIRFIYYFGLPGLLVFIWLYVIAAHYGTKLCPGYGLMYFLLFTINMIVWVKVATDTFVVFALLLNAGVMQNGLECTEEREMESNAV